MNNNGMSWAERVQAQQDSLKDGDKVIRMTYSRYKKHYADCETVLGSFEKANSYSYASMISVIVRAGRMKASGTRGETYSYYIFKNEAGDTQEIKAVSLENAERRMQGTGYSYCRERGYNTDGTRRCYIG